MTLWWIAVGGAAFGLVAVCASALWFARGGAVPAGDVIFVFGAGYSAEDGLDRASRLRVETGVALWHAGAAPRILFSGGPDGAGQGSAAEAMAALARAEGVDAGAIVVEGRATSTLQNAWYGAQLLPEGSRVIAVTEGYHMARAMLAARWAGLRVSGYRTSTAFRTGAGSGTRMVLREVAAWPFNLGRVGVFAAAGLVGMDEAARARMLR